MENLNGNMEVIVSDLMSMATEYGLSAMGAIAILIIGWIAAGWVRRTLLRVLGRSERVDETIGRFVASVARYAVLIFTGVAVLEAFGVETTSFVAVMGAMGLAVGFALQGTLGHIAAGVMLLFFRPFKVGDFVETSAATGTVQNIGLFVTEMTTPDNLQIIVPNGAIWGAAIKNFSANDRRRADLDIGVGYDADLNDAIRVIGEVLAADERVFEDPEPLIAVSLLGDSSVNILARYWSASSDFFALRLELTKALKERLDQEGINIPYPQMDVHMVKEG